MLFLGTTEGKRISVFEWTSDTLLPFLTSHIYIYFVVVVVLVYACAEGCLLNWPQEGIKLNKITVHRRPLNMAF